MHGTYACAHVSTITFYTGIHDNLQVILFPFLDGSLVS
jgi:hypothetical protein